MESLHTSISLQETIDFCAVNLGELFARTISELLILFNQKSYKQHDGVVMTFQLGATLANAFLCYPEKIWHQNCPSSVQIR